ncbi:MAG TPA: hypothetical protein VFW07_11090 [Parafilimonas sp.]|nr:hypothetical protein [Parafilimonas sp.]
MKTINVDIDDQDYKEPGISGEHISIEESKQKILIQSIRRQREMLQAANEKYGFDALSEEEIFDAVNEAEIEYKKNKNFRQP